MNRKLKVGCGIGLASMALCLGGVYLAFGNRLDLFRASGELPAAYAEARRLQLPLTPAELQEALEVPDAENAAPEFRKLATAQAKPSFDSADFEVALASDRPAARQMLEAQAATLDLARAAARKGRLDMDRKWIEGPNLAFPEYASAKSAVQLLAASAILRATDGDADGAIADLEAAKRLGRLVGDEPTLISMLVMIACDAIVNRSAERVGEALRGNPRALDRLANLEAVARPAPPFHFYLEFEVLSGITVLRNLDQYGGLRGLLSMGDLNSNYSPPEIDPAKLRADGLPSGVAARAMLARHLQVWNRIWPTVSNPNTDVRDSGNLLDKEMDRIEKEPGVSYTAAQIFVPVFGQAGQASVRNLAQTRVTRSYLRTLAYRARNGRFPATLAQAGVRETDPFDGAPLRYRTDGKTFRVWSVGADGQDDGGKTRHEVGTVPPISGGSPTPEDIVAGFPEPKRRVARP